MSKQDWENNTELDIRTRIAVRLLLLAVKIMSPYRFEHRFSDEFAELNNLLNTKESNDG